MRGLFQRSCILFLLLAPVFAPAALNQNLSEAVQSVEKIEEGKQTWRTPEITKEISAEEISKLRRDAFTKDAEAQARLGLCYQLGFGVPRSLSEATNWYEKAVTRNHPGAQNNLAMLYDVGAGMSEDRAKAHQLYLAAAIQGLPQAQFNLAVNWAEGWPVRQNWQEARQWYEKAAAQGHLPAMCNLGNIYLLGRGVPVDRERARKLFEKPANAGLAIAQFSLSVSYTSQGDLASSVPWLRKSAEGGFVSGQFYWAVSLMEGVGVERDLKQALKWARVCIANTLQVAPKLLPDSQALLAQILIEWPGAGDREAFQMANAAAGGGSIRAHSLVGLCYYRGIGTERDIPVSLAWLRKAADKGMPEAAGVLGSAYEIGEGVERHMGEALRWYRLAIQGGSGPVCMRVGNLLMEGNGLPRNLEEAGRCFQRILDYQPKDERARRALAEVEMRKKAGIGEETYQKGLDMARDAEEGKGTATMAAAIDLLNAAAEIHRHPRAAATLATIYRRGLGVPRDEARAEKLIAQIQAQAPVDRAVLYQMAIGYLPSSASPQAMDPRAVEWLRMSATQGYSSAQGAFGLYLMSAPEGIRDPIEAMKWLILSSMEAFPAGRVNAEKLRLTMTFEQLEEVRRRVRDFSTGTGTGTGVPARANL